MQKKMTRDGKKTKISAIIERGLKGVRRSKREGSGSYTVYTMARQSALRLIHEKDRRGRLAGDLGSYCASREDKSSLPTPPRLPGGRGKSDFSPIERGNVRRAVDGDVTVLCGR